MYDGRTVHKDNRKIEMSAVRGKRCLVSIDTVTEWL